MHANGGEANHDFPKILLKVNWIAADLWRVNWKSTLYAFVCVCEWMIFDCKMGNNDGVILL